MQPRQVWNLPTATDAFLFDDDLLHDSVVKHQALRKSAFEQASEAKDTTEMMRQTNLVFEAGLMEACVTTDGYASRLPQGCLGRCRKKTCKRVPASTPVMKHAREGHFNPETLQATVSIRRRTKQVRRLQSLAEQLDTMHDPADPSPASHALGGAILHAPGYHQSFQTFALNELGLFIPSTCPMVEYVRYLVQVFKAFVQDEVRAFMKVTLQCRKDAGLKDIKQGGGHAFASVRDPQQPPYHSIRTTNKVQLRKQRWVKTGLKTVLVQGSCDTFDTSRPVYFQDQERFIVSFDATSVTFDRRVRNRDKNDLTLWQQSVVADISELHKQTAQAWGEMWQRDEADTDWTSAINALNSFSGFPEIEYEALDVDEWKRHANQVSNKSARGSCGYTPRELVMMPSTLTQWILDMLALVEDAYAQWPAPLMIARVVMLAKGDTPPDHPLHTRPITITSRLYRTWARYRALQVINILAHRLPPSVAGSMAGVSADLMAAALLDRIETAHICDAPVLGCTVDLVKCYNMVPRQPILLAMAEMGIPIPYLTALESMFVNLQRVLEISGQIGDPQRSTTGIPEGCCFSIVAMMTLSVWIHMWLQQGPYDIDFAAYADNWTLMTTTPEGLHWGIHRVLQLVECLAMRVATDKSWAWASHAKFRKILRQIMPFPVCLVATELGCGASYCRKTTKTVAKKRIAKVKRVMSRLKGKKIPRPFQIKMSNQLSSGVLGYGSEVTYFTHSEFKGIRAACCKAVGRAWSGCNPHLSMYATGDTRDPELALLIRKCFFWRRFLRSFHGRMADFAFKLQQEHGKQSGGPVGIFVRTLHDNGWSINEEGHLVHDRGWILDWLQVSKGHLVRMMTLAWNVKVCRIVSNRKHFDMECMDVVLGKKCHRIQTAHKTHAVSWAIGRHVTNDALVHYAHGTTTDRCPLCNNKDGRLHRVLECPHLSGIRQQHAETIRWLQTQDETTAYFGLLSLDLTLADTLLSNWTPIPRLQLQGPAEAPSVVVFTDGSALHTTMFFTTCAAGAFIVVEGDRVLEEHAEPLPGQEQTSYRGEIWGIILALTKHVRLNLHSDCAAMLNVLQQLIVARRSHSKPGYSDHVDLWSIVWDLLQSRPPDAVEWTKVKAHTHWQHQSCPVLRWQGKMNEHVDSIAKRCAHRALRPHTGARQAFDNRRKRDRGRIADYHALVAKCNIQVFAQSQKQRDVRVSPMPTLEMHFDPSRAITLSCKLSNETLATCPLGPVFAKRLCDYF
eukprot:Skav214266  [mRNA]  locus=scaffold642:431:4159:- [translate_table: standard]